MEALFEFNDNTVPEVLVEKIYISCVIIVTSLVFAFMMTKNYNKEEYQEDEDEYQEDEDEYQDNEDESDNNQLNLENVRNFIESHSDESCEYKVLQSIIIPKKGDYVELTEGRWKYYVGRITSIINSGNINKYNIKVAIRDNIDFGSDIPHHLLKDKDRDFFSVLTDNEIKSYNLLSENEYIERYSTTVY